jgi:hypothetical protein
MQKTPQGAGSSAISIQRASNSKPVEVEGLHLVTSLVKNLQLARPKLSEAGRRKLKKIGTDQNDTGGLVQPGYETLLHQTMGPNTPRSDKCTHMGQPPKNPRSPVEPESCRKALVNFTAASLLDYPKG